MSKFTLQAGTTNRHQWHKQAVGAIRALDGLRYQRRELYGVKGGEERSSIVSVMFGDIENQTAEDLLNGIGERFNWEINKENASSIVEAVAEVLPIARDAMPIDDNRETPEQKAERVQAMTETSRTREEERGRLMEEVSRLADEMRISYPWAIADDGKMSGYARAAKNMKKELSLTFPGVTFSVRSESFSMGNAVRVEWDNGPCVKSVEVLTKKYMYYIDKCTDDNSAQSKAVGAVLGQSKYVTTQRNVSPELKEQVGRDICTAYGEEYDTDARINGRWLSEIVWLALGVDITGTYAGVELVKGECVAQFEAAHAPVMTDAPAVGGDGIAAHIEEHTHTKKGFTMYMVVPDDRLERDTFDQVRSAAKAAGGWYSRKWGGTPGGFAFESRAEAESFLASLSGDTPTDEPPTPRKGRGDQFRTMADNLQNQIDNKLGDRLTNTPKRMAQANHARLDGERLQRTQQALYGLAGLYDAGAVPPELAGITSKKAVYDLMGTITEMVPNGFHTYSFCTGEPRHTTPGAVALWALITGKTEDQKQAEELRRKVEGLQFVKIPGYFPTPDHVIDNMIDLAKVRDGDSVCEPSAGSGAIADRVPGAVCYEANHALREILTEKGHTVAGDDFMQCRDTFDKIIMNPPFESNQDIKHIKHAVSLLNPGGVVVAICSNGAKREELLRPLSTHWEQLPAGTFKGAGTNIVTNLLVIEKEY